MEIGLYQVQSVLQTCMLQRKRAEALRNMKGMRTHNIPDAVTNSVTGKKRIVFDHTVNRVIDKIVKK